MLTPIEEILDKQTTIVVVDKFENKEIKESTTIAPELLEGANIGDVLIYRVYNDGHAVDVNGEYALIPRDVVLNGDHDEIFLKGGDNIKEAHPIAICIGDDKFMSVDEDYQPWAGDVYTGLFRTNYCWQTTPTKIIDTETNIDATPWLSEIDGKANTDKVLWLIDDNIDTSTQTAEIKFSHQTFRDNLYDDLYAKFNFTKHEKYHEDEFKSIFGKDESDSEFILVVNDLSYYTYVLEFFDEYSREFYNPATLHDISEYGVSVKDVKDAFSKARKNVSTNDQFEDNESFLWKELTYANNVFINKNNDAIPLTVRYEYIPGNTDKLGFIYTSDNIIFQDAQKRINPIYSLSSNAFMYAKEYSSFGTKPGDWYLGSKEEMHNLMNYDTIVSLNEVFEKLGVQKIDVIDNPNYLTSSQTWYNSNYCYSIYTHYRYCAAIDKRVVCHVRLLLNTNAE